MFGLGLPVDNSDVAKSKRERYTQPIKGSSQDREAIQVTTLTNEERGKAYSTIVTSALDFVPKLKLAQVTDVEDIDTAYEVFDSIPQMDINLFQDGTLRDALYIWVANQEDDDMVKALLSVIAKSMQDKDPYGNEKVLNVMAMVATMTFMKGALDASLEMAGKALSNCPDISDAPSALNAISKALVVASTGDMLRTREIAYSLKKSCLSLDNDEFWKANF